jgi:hypothetical protein
VSLKDDLLKHKIFTLRYAGTLATYLKEFLKGATEMGTKELALNPNGLSKVQLQKLNKKLMLSADNALEKQFKALQDLVQYEVAFISKKLVEYNLVETVVTPDQETLNKKLRKTGMGVVSGKNNKTIESAYKQFLQTKIKEIVLVVGDLSVRRESKENL